MPLSDFNLMVCAFRITKNSNIDKNDFVNVFNKASLNNIMPTKQKSSSNLTPINYKSNNVSRANSREKQFGFNTNSKASITDYDSQKTFSALS